MKVRYMMSSSFREPVSLTLDVVVDAASSYPGKHHDLRRSSPEEEHHAYILATDRDLSLAVNVEGWQRAWRSSVSKMQKIESLQQIFWQAARSRERIGEQFDCLYYSTAAWHNR